MRILHISTRLILGGSQENTILSCEGQAALGHEVHLAFGPIYGPEGSMLGRVEKWNNEHTGTPIHTHTIPAMVRELHPVKDIACFRQLRALIARLGPDIVHTHSSKAGIIGRAAAWSIFTRNLRSIPPPAAIGARGGVVADWRGGAKPGVVHTIHGPPFHRHEQRWKNRIYIEAERYAAARCHRIVSVADAMTSQFLAARIGTPSLYTTVRSGIEMAEYERARTDGSRDRVRAELGIGDHEVVLGTVSRLAELKGHGDILDAMGPILRERPDIRLLWVGDGWLRGELEARIGSMGLHGRVVLTGLVPPDRIPPLLAAMDVLIHASYREGLPRCVVQAMAMGVPVVASDVDGTCEVVIDQETGRLFVAGDPRVLRESVAWMLADPARRRAVAQAGRARVVPAFSAERMVADLEVVYTEALECARGMQR